MSSIMGWERQILHPEIQLDFNTKSWKTHHQRRES
jgi:hypothetical protein